MGKCTQVQPANIYWELPWYTWIGNCIRWQSDGWMITALNIKNKMFFLWVEACSNFHIPSKFVWSCKRTDSLKWSEYGRN